MGDVGLAVSQEMCLVRSSYAADWPLFAIKHKIVTEGDSKIKAFALINF